MPELDLLLRGGTVLEGVDNIMSVLRPGRPRLGLSPGHSDQRCIAAELKGFVKDKLGPYKYPSWIEFVPELPKTATGKIRQFKLR